MGSATKSANDGRGFYLDGTGWGVAQVAHDGTPDAELTDDLAAILGTEPVHGGG